MIVNAIWLVLSYTVTNGGHIQLRPVFKRMGFVTKSKTSLSKPKFEIAKTREVTVLQIPPQLVIKIGVNVAQWTK